MSDEKTTSPSEEKQEPSFWETALEALMAATPIIGPSAAALLRSSEDSKKASETNDLQVLTDEAERQRIELQVAEMQARVAQEMAIAQRIQSATEVEIEEYYEGTGEGNAGVTAQKGVVTLGATGKGSKVTKRVYRFKGHDEKVIEQT